MKKSPLIHGVLLVVALGWAYQTWTRDKTTKPERSQVTVWGGSPGDIVRLAMTSEGKDVKVERRQGDTGTYLWGMVTRTPPAPKAPAPKATPDGGAEAPSSPEAPSSLETQPPPPPQVREFPVGEDGSKLLGKLAPLRALRDLGTFDEKRGADYGLAEAKDTLTVELRSGARKLLVGGTVYGGNDRYVMDPESKQVYVLAGDVLQSLETADSSLRERKLHGFAPEDVSRVVVKGTAKERTLVRRAGAAPAAPPTWADTSTPDKPDQTLANFMDRVGKLSAMEFVTSLAEAELTTVVSVDYQGPGKKGVLGRLQLFKKAADTAGKFDYYLKTELTRVLAKVQSGSAERVEQDLGTL